MQFAKAGAASLRGLDLSPSHYDLASRRFALAGVPVDLRLHDAESPWPFADESADLVYSFGVLHHTPHPERALREAYRVLRPGGRVLIGLYHRHSLVTVRHWLMWVLRRGWRVESYETSWWRIEGHQEDTTARPLVDRYSRRQIRRLLADAGFRVTRVRIEHAALHTHRMGRHAPHWLIRLLDRTVGWYVIAEAHR
jgi:SAM-dependent methyltransferase